MRDLRLLRELTQEQLAERAGVSNKEVSLIELGKRNAGLDTLAALARSLDVDPSAFFEQAGVRRGLAVVSARELDVFIAAGRAAVRLGQTLARPRSKSRPRG